MQAINSNTNTICCYEDQLIPVCHQENLEDTLWSQLPEELIERILLWLPVASTVQFRSVCTKWKYLLLSDRYYRHRYQIDVKRPWFFLCTTGKFSCVFDFEMNRWHRIPNPAIPRASILTAAGNIVCLGNLVAECKVLTICNPISKTLKQLPATRRVQLIHKVSITLDKDAQSYKIMVAGEDRAMPTMASRVYRLFTEFYDSKAGFWKMAGNPLAHAKFGSDPGVWCNGLFYCITELPYGVVIFDPENGVWSELEAAMPSLLATPSLVESNGRLLMVGRVVDNSHMPCRNTVKVQIWQLDQFFSNNTAVVAWTELQQVPQSIYSEFMAPLKSYSPLICSGIGDWVCIATHLSPHTLAFNLCYKKWRWLPTDPLFPENRNFHLLALSFEPRSDCPL
eukprot:Gb_21514 [translate_table: standard]